MILVISKQQILLKTKIKETRIRAIKEEDDINKDA